MTKRDRSWGDRPRRTGLPRALGRFFGTVGFLELALSEEPLVAGGKKGSRGAGARSHRASLDP